MKYMTNGAKRLPKIQIFTDPKHRDDADNLRKDIAISKKIFNRGNGANVRF